MRKKNADYIDEYLKIAEVLHCGTNNEFNLFLFGDTERHGITEEYLPYLWKKGKLKRTRIRKKDPYVYVVKRKARKFDEMFPKLPHYLGASRCLARIWASNREGQIFHEKEFYKLGVVPEWGIWYPEKINKKGELQPPTILLLEFCTEIDFRYSGVMRGKLSAYERNLVYIEEEFQAQATVLFVLEIDRSAVERYVGSLASARPDGDTFPEPFYFVDYKTFLSVPLGQQLKAPIYFYIDGKEQSLSE